VCAMNNKDVVLYGAGGERLARSPEWIKDLPAGQINIAGHWWVVDSVMIDGLCLKYVGPSRKLLRKKSR